MIKKILLGLCLGISFSSSFALNFLGQELENLNRKELTELLNKNGAKIKNKESLVDTFNLKGSKIPYSSFAIAYYNKQDEFVGLKIGFTHEDDNLINLRKNLVNKYGNNYFYINNFGEKNNNNNELNKEYFSEKAQWTFPNNTTIEYNAKTFDQEKGFSNDLTSYSFIFFREEKRKKLLIEELKNESKKAYDEKFKGVF